MELKVGWQLKPGEQWQSRCDGAGYNEQDDGETAGGEQSCSTEPSRLEGGAWLGSCHTVSSVLCFLSLEPGRTGSEAIADVQKGQ